MKYLIIYLEIEHMLNFLSQEEKGDFLDLMISYAKNQKVPVIENKNVLNVFNFIKDRLDTQIEKALHKAEVARENGRKGGRKDKPKETQSEPKETQSVNELKKQFEEIYRLYNKEKKLKVIPFDKLKTKFQSCLKDITFEELKQSVNDYLKYLSTETWRKKKAFDAWINSPEFYANDWKNESKESKPNDSNDLSKWSKY